MREPETTATEWSDVDIPAGDDPTQSALGDYRVDLPAFEGPLDLLLHLIRQHEIDVFDIPISLILDRYTEYLDWMQDLNLDICGEFLVMAATLAQIKSRMLLPPDESAEQGEGLEEGDPREELVRRLLEYQKYKEAARELNARPMMNRDMFNRGGQFQIEAGEESPFAGVSVFKLIEALDRVMKKTSSKVTHQVLMERVSLADRIHELCDLLLQRKELVFEEMFALDATKMMVVLTFMAILEMARLRMLRLHQADGSEIIHIRSLLAAETDVIQTLASVKLDD